ncbi:EpsG family protein [Cetobacterium somerae]|uniref:EpsG family protein n=1 Tax=Cetobacterium somerae TaxID=188913 RepID=UPI00211EF92B|nr:EpsG family protein [Cetobacterium somerae]MCQ9628388.1 EpsG family protein [Cetobacterium somerae]
MLNLNILIYPFIGILSIIGILKNKEKIIFKFLSVLLLFLSMVRFDTGYDYYWYYAVSKTEFMNDAQIIEMYKGLEPGIKKIIDIARYFNHPQYFFAVTALITCGFIFYTIFRDSEEILISLNLFLFFQLGFFSTNGMVRQACAFAICYFSARLIYDRRWLEGAALIILAAIFFHNSAIICLIYLFVPRKKIKTRYFLIYGILLVIVLKTILPKLISIYFPGYYYLLFLENNELYGKRDIVLSGLIILGVLILRYLKMYKISENEKSYYSYLENLFIGGAIFSIISLFEYGGFFPFRVGIYFLIFILTLGGNYIKELKFDQKNILKIGVIIFINVYFFRGIIKKDYFILNKKIERNNEKKIDYRPNSYGFKLFFGKTENDMERYLPSGTKHERTAE